MSIVTAWTSQLLDSSVALDPIVGSEVVKTISVFLEQRSKVLPRQRVEDTAGMSQDDFGMFDLDFADPALDAMLGVCENASAATGDDPRTQDQKFAQVIQHFLQHLGPVLTVYYRSSSKTSCLRPSFGSSPTFSSPITEAEARSRSLIATSTPNKW